MPRGTPNSKPEKQERDVEQQRREALFTQALREVLPSLKLYSDDRIRQRVGAEKLEDLALELFGFMEAGAGQLNHTEQSALAFQILRCLSKYVSVTLGIPVTLKTLTDNIALLQYSVDSAFPGYFNSGLLKYSILPLRKVF